MSSYIDSHLLQNEQVIYQTKQHWITFLSIKGLATLFIAPMIDRSTSEYAITSKRIIIKIGWFSSDAYEMNLAKIESVMVHQTLMGRIFGYGNITVVGTGGSRETFDTIHSPCVFKQTFQEYAM